MKRKSAASAAAFLAAAAVSQVSFGQVPAGSTNVTSLPLYDPFGYYGAGSGDLYNQGPWKTTIASSAVPGPGSVNQVQVVNNNLVYSGLNTSANGAVDLDPTGVNVANKYEGAKLGIPSTVANDGVTVYYFSFLVKATDVSLIPTSTTATALADGSASATIGNLFAGFNTDRVANTMTLGAPFVRIRRAGGSTDNTVTNWELGLQRDGGNVTAGLVWESTPHAIDDTVMVVGRYQSNTGTGNDQMDLWVNPSSSTFGLAETNLLTSVPSTLSVSTGGADRAIQDFFLRRQADGAHLLLDDVRLSNTWADVAPNVWRGDTGGDSNNWGNSTNWQTGTVPDATGVRPSFLDIASASKTPHLTANRTVGGMTFNSATGYTLSADSGVALTIASSDTMVRPTDAGNRAFGNVARFNVANGNHTISAPINGSATLVVEGNGTLTLTNANSHTGDNVIGGGVANGGGTLAINSDAALGAVPGNPANPNIFGDGGKLQFLSSFDLNANRTIQILDRGLILDTNGFNSSFGGAILTYGGTSPLTKDGAGQFTFSGSAGTHRSLVLKGGTFAALHTILLGEAPTPAVRITFDGGTLRMLDTTDGSGPNFGVNRNVNITAAGGTIQLDATGSSIISGVVSGTGPWTKSGAGTLTLTNSNPYSGPLTIAQGTLNAASFADVNTNSAIGKGSLAGSAADLVLNGGTLQYTGAAAQSTNRLFTLGTGASTIDASSSANAPLAFTGAGAVAFTGSGARTLTLTGSSTGANTLAAVVGDGTGGATTVVKSGGGSWVLSGNNNTYTGGTNVQTGTLEVKKMHAANAVTVAAGATLRVLASAPTGTDPQSGDNAFVSRPSTLTVDPAGFLDITNNDVIIDYTGATPVAAYEALVASAYNVTGDWAGPGITSSIAAIDGNYIVAIADNATLAAPFGTAQGGPLFSGVDVDLDTILIKFTHRADINLDGLITPDDSAIFGGNYDENQPATWATGDMNYDGIYTPDDAAIFGGAYDESLNSLPEPGCLGVLGLAGVLMARRSRRSAV